MSTCSAKSRRRGFNLVEAANVLGVVGLVIGGIWVAAAQVRENQRQVQAVTDVISIIANLRQLYANMPLPVNGGTNLIATQMSGALGQCFSGCHDSEQSDFKCLGR